MRKIRERKEVREGIKGERGKEMVREGGKRGGRKRGRDERW